MGTQLDVDYTNEAQMRVAAQTLLLEKKAVVTVPSGSRTVAIADDIVRITAAFAGTTRLESMTTDEMICELSAVYETNVSSTPMWALIGRTFYLTPAPSTDYRVTIIYAARPAAYESDQPLEVQGEAENLVERLVAAYRLIDDGQPERGAAELHSYEEDARLYQGVARSRGGTPRRMLVPGYDLHL